MSKIGESGYLLLYLSIYCYHPCWFLVNIDNFNFFLSFYFYKKISKPHSVLHLFTCSMRSHNCCTLSACNTVSSFNSCTLTVATHCLLTPAHFLLATHSFNSCTLSVATHCYPITPAHFLLATLLSHNPHTFSASKQLSRNSTLSASNT